ncbi:hypothetical protein HPB50_014687 [Hyalomma asiaticum]|uniref:Uncharacterized protein n=1 Tax=Hyalomma asiaticum TaxID=266040 RepID=A0ACB7SWA1_HYAAI|nr:hypothetical protein HPB50_014687 [Hyalomma asiaticum]
MDLSKLRKPDLVMLCEEMGIEVAALRRKPLLIQALEDSGADEEELSECWELIQERMKRESEDKERETVRRKEQAEIQIREIERLRLQLQIVEAKCASSVREENAEIQADARLSMRDLLQPYKMSEDIALFLVNFERTCARVGFDRATWPQKLLTVLPCEAADTLARLPETDADDYNKIKVALLKKFRLSAEAFRRRFRDAQKTTSETFQEFAFNMKADLVEWLKGEGVYEDRDKVVDLISLEQFYGSIDEQMRLWIQDRPGERNIERAAELADEYTVRRQSEKARVRPFSKQPLKDRPERKGPFTVKNATENEAKENSEKEKNFESKKPLLCFRCQEPGHIAAGCRKPKLVFSVTGSDDENMQLLRPYLRDLVVNGKDCKVLRDSGATMDIVHPDYVEATHFTGECAWIRQVARKNSICLPIAKVTIEGPFGVLETEAAVSPNLPKQYPYLFSNKSDMLLKKRGLSFGEFVVQAITRSKARELAAERAGEGEQPRAVDPCEQASTSAGEDGSRYVAPVTLGDSSATDAPIPLSPKETACDVVEPAFPRIVLPHSECSLDLLNVDEDTLMRKAPIELVPLITEPFKLPVDVVGPIPVIKSGYKYLLTMVFPAIKFPEAIQLSEVNAGRPVLKAPDFDRSFVLQCDASDRGTGDVLSQNDADGNEHPVEFVSRKLKIRVQAYSASEKECARLVWAIHKLQCYLNGSHIVVQTDPCPLTWLRSMSSRNGRLLRWSLALQEHRFEIKYRKGRER